MVEEDNGIHAVCYKLKENFEAQMHRNKHVETATNEGGGDWLNSEEISTDYATRSAKFLDLM